MYYAGIGSRDTPEDIGVIMTKLAIELESLGWCLRSGGARGADTFFERGVSDPTNKQIFLHKEVTKTHVHNPVEGIYNASRCKDWDWAMQLASEVHPKWHKCNKDAQGLHARNVYQVLGTGSPKLSTSNMVICWAIPDIHGVPEGGTRTAWKVAERYNISRYNLAVRADRERITKWLESRKVYEQRES
ncbi:hypothetical protein [Pseudomonas sp. P8_250]|uniref:hypothetical protein n=1 Tax=Pseudomonas sp. P8_250 TaxID=3043446 RepID=UPI002A364E60|nr:hypothetical protein [Pseudomonas sp. P8_250]MDX9668702.1 hypothetical protein [Pseudomonas sp. P8_250]